MPIEGRGVVVWEAGGPVVPEPILIDEPGPGEILVRIEASGVCHTDLHVRDGKIGAPPMLLGHEGAGVVEAVGDGVSEPRVGDYVIDLRRRALDRLREVYQQLDPFKFILYSEWADAELRPVA